jgi:hypothetical protein
MIREVTRVGVALATIIGMSASTSQGGQSSRSEEQSDRKPNPFHYNCSDTSIRGSVVGEEGGARTEDGSARTMMAESGTTSEESLLGLSAIVVTVYSYNSLLGTWIPAGIGETDITGLFIIPLPVYGTYRVEFWDPLGEYQTEYWNDKPTFAQADNIYLNSTTPAANISAALAPAN